MSKGYYLALMLLVGAYLPSSLHGTTSYAMIALGYACALCLLCYGAWKFGASEVAVVCGLLILTTLAACTLFGSLTTIRLEKVGIFGTMAMMLCLRSRGERVGSNALLIVSTINIAIGIGIIAGIEPVVLWVERFYSAFFDGLVPSMLDLHKPVLSYGTHSIAAFFLYMFYWLNFRTFQVTGRRLNLACAIVHALLCAALLSHASFGFAALAFSEMGWHALSRSRYVTIASVLALAALMPVVIRAFDPKTSGWNAIQDVAKDYVVYTWVDKEGGLLARYGAGGDLAEPVAYIANHPLRPIGLSSSEKYVLVDSGPVEYMMRGSLLLVILIYGGLWYFLRAHLQLWDALRMMLCVLVMETGFSVLLYQRTALLLPAFVLYLSGLDVRSSSDKGLGGKKWNLSHAPA
jgi:hypothetical protein